MTLPPGPGGPTTAVTHLFRHSLRDGRVHPLLHVLQRFRQASAR